MPPTLQKTTLNGASRHQLTKGFILVGDGGPPVEASVREQIVRYVNQALAQQSDLSGFTAEARPGHASLVGLTTSFLPIYDVAQRDAFITRLATATSYLAQVANQAGYRLAASGVNPYATDTDSQIPALCADVHRIEVFDDGEIERIYNLYRQFLPELLALSTHAGIYNGAIQKDFSLRMRLNPASFLPRYLSQFSAEYLDKLERMMRKDYGLSDLRQMDVNPLAGDSTKLTQDNPPLLDKAPAAIELRFVDAQCAYPFIRAQVILLQSIAMYGRSLARQGKRLPYMQDEVVDENKALAVQSGPSAILKPDPKFIKDDGVQGYSFHDRGEPERATTALLMTMDGLLLPSLRELECQYWEIAPIVLGAELRRRGKRCLVNYAEYQKYLFYTSEGRFDKVLQEQVQQLLSSPDLDYITDYNRDTYSDLAAEIEQDWTEKLKPAFRHKGWVLWYNAQKRYGFIRSETGDDIHVQQADIEGADQLEDGRAVTFEILERRRRQSAVRVRIELQQRYTGRVVTFDATKGFGFIKAGDVDNVFVHQSDVEGSKKLSVGNTVSFETIQSDKGPRAVRVKVKEQPRQQGKVNWFDAKKRFGFITQADGSDIFVHQSDLDGVSALKKGQSVSFEIGRGRKGPKAIRVRVTEEE